MQYSTTIQSTIIQYCNIDNMPCWLNDTQQYQLGYSLIFIHEVVYVVQFLICIRGGTYIGRRRIPIHSSTFLQCMSRQDPISTSPISMSNSCRNTAASWEWWWRENADHQQPPPLQLQVVNSTGPLLILNGVVKGHQCYMYSLEHNVQCFMQLSWDFLHLLRCCDVCVPSLCTRNFVPIYFIVKGTK